MKKTMSRTVAFLLVAVMMLSAMPTIQATDMSLRSSTIISSYSASISASGSKITISFKITGTKILDSIGAYQIKLQKQDGSSWVTYHTFDSVLKSNAAVCSDSVSKSNVASGVYRAYVTFYASDGTTTENKYYTTSTVTVS